MSTETTTPTFAIGDRVQLVRGPHPRWTGTVIDLVGGEFPYRVLWDDGNGYETCCAYELRALVTA